eukprot:2857730-Rhodomonas_salina.1
MEVLRTGYLEAFREAGLRRLKHNTITCPIHHSFASLCTAEAGNVLGQYRAAHSTARAYCEPGSTIR